MSDINRITAALEELAELATTPNARAYLSTMANTLSSLQLATDSLRQAPSLDDWARAWDELSRWRALEPLEIKSRRKTCRQLAFLAEMLGASRLNGRIRNVLPTLEMWRDYNQRAIEEATNEADQLSAHVRLQTVTREIEELRVIAD